ncbi:MAG: hypothetical protein JO057_31065, partial [Chloroflexi bacterium]|nr:hypothetical protein [Chloroflexota bacterium]
MDRLTTGRDLWPVWAMIERSDTSATSLQQLQTVPLWRAEESRERKRDAKAEQCNIGGVRGETQVRLCGVRTHQPQAADWRGQRSMEPLYIHPGQLAPAGER